MMLTGRTLGTGWATAAEGGQKVFFMMIKPHATAANLAIVRAEGDRYVATSKTYDRLVARGSLDLAVARRAVFAASVLRVAGENLEAGLDNLVLVAQDVYQRIAAVMIYDVEHGAGLIELLAIDPLHLRGSPGRGQLRGLGMAMIAAVSREFLAMGALSVCLHPKDDAARRFWEARGFRHVSGLGFCVWGREQIEALIDGCVLQGSGAAETVECGRVVAHGRPLLHAARG